MSIQTYLPTWESLSQHPVPEWYHDAKFGIFLHWGPSAVPGWAPLTGGFSEILRTKGDRYWFANNPYAEWYCQAMRIPGSPTARYHAATYGADTPYDAFIPAFNHAVRDWDPAPWADLFQRAGARYVVLISKHHDGFLLWPSDTPNPYKPGWQAERDLVGELTNAVRARGMRMGLYYSGGLDFTFNDLTIYDIVDVLAAAPTSPEYAAYAEAHWRELIRRYAPSILWNDIGYPAGSNLPALFADYYAAVPEGVVNDRFSQSTFDSRAVEPPSSARAKALRGVLRYLGRQTIAHPEGWLARRLPGNTHHDFRTPEYASYTKAVSRKWETTRGLGYSFGYNRNETPETWLSLRELIHMLIDAVSKNGNLLLDIGPMADGTIPEAYRERLEGLGAWLAINGEAIFDTRPWDYAEGWTDAHIPLRFTQSKSGDALYAILLGAPQKPRVGFYGKTERALTSVTLLGYPEPLRWKRRGNKLTVEMPAGLQDAPALTLKFAF